MDELIAPDVEIRDGDELTFGSVKMKFYLVPGHTEGCISFFFDVTEGNRTVRAGYYGGFGFNTLAADYLTEIGDPQCHMREIYLDSLKRSGMNMWIFSWEITASTTIWQKSWRRSKTEQTAVSGSTSRSGAATWMRSGMPCWSS